MREIYYAHPKNSSTKMDENMINESFLEIHDKCGCCENKEFRLLMPFYQKPEINMVQCCRCGAVTYDKIFSQEGLSERYLQESYYEDYEIHGTSKVTFYGEERLARHILKNINLPDGIDIISILDFGGGDGAIAYNIGKLLINTNKCKSVKITVVDYNDKLYNSGDQAITLTHQFPLDEVGDELFDIVVASAIIEHLIDPRKYMIKLFDCIKSGGYIYFRTPYMFPLYKFLKKIGMHVQTGYPDHIWDLNESWWEHADSIVGYPKGKMKLVRSSPSIVEKSLRIEFTKALVAYIMKSIWYVFHSWKFVGGWETVWRKQ